MAASRSRDQRKAASVLPDPVGATTRAWSPLLIASHAPSWAAVGRRNAPVNQARVASENRSRADTTTVSPAGTTARRSGRVGRSRTARPWTPGGQTASVRPPLSSTPGTSLPGVGPDLVERRTVGGPRGGVALAGLGVTVGVAVGGLLARDVAGTETAAGLGQTAGVLGAAVLAVPLARISDRAGRRAGLAAGYAVAVLGSLVTVVAAVVSSLPLLLVGLFAFGAATTCGLQARYAAADLAVPEHRGRALSLVVWATTVGSVVGPNLAGPGADLGRALGLPALGGAFVVSATVFAVVALGVLALLRPDPLLVARRLGGGGAGVRPRRATGAAVRAVWASPTGPLGLTAVVVSHAVMVGVMVMTPVHMGHAHGSAGTTLRVIGVVISVHVAGMYLFSPLVGMLADGAGRTATVALCGALLLAAAALAGTAPPGAAVQLGVGL